MPARYELLYIIPSSFTDEEIGTIETKVSGILAKYQASIESTKRLGKFRLAYPIEHQRHGHYVLVMFEAEKPNVAKIEENLRITSELLRHMILRADEAGSDQKYDLVQFMEVNVESKEDRPRHRDRTPATRREVAIKSQQEIKSGVEALEVGAQKKEDVIATPDMSSEDLDKKIETALSEDVTGV
ncbi:MAG: 30S ribosomal protein S6 [Candidatus Uhrbacteria bacterium]|nr:30S ribosomal protein S6 [Candidatus Uhrbacteria bacterium]